jgi:hypothetical protein
MPLQKTFKGVNLGSWLLMEGYILGGANIAESNFKSQFEKRYGKKELTSFESLFRDNFITKQDFQRIALLGANVIRVPFNYRLLEKSPYVYSRKGFSYLDKVFSWAKCYGLGVILDLHAAPGAQNYDWHADSSGRALLWEKPAFQNRTYALWEKIADRFKDQEALVGYDVLNEPVLGSKSIQILKRFYQKVIKSIRAVDKKSIIFLEGDNWAQDIDFLTSLIQENIAISIHTYQPIDYTFNFTPFYRFPGKIGGIIWDKRRIYKYLEPYNKFSRKNKVRIFVGEFGINWRGGSWGEAGWLEAMLKAFEDYGFSYTYWTYKAVANQVFPDGLYQQVANCKYINREGPARGWDTYLEHWKKDKKSIVDFWKTKNFTPNQKLINTLRRFLKK